MNRHRFRPVSVGGVMVSPAPTDYLIAMESIRDTPIEMRSLTGLCFTSMCIPTSGAALGPALRRPGSRCLTGWWYDDALPKTMEQFLRT